MRQLSLFDHAELPTEPADPVPGAQLDLFDQRSLGLARVGEAILQGDLGVALAELSTLRARLRDDPAIREHIRVVSRLHKRLESASSFAPLERSPVVIAVARELLGMAGAYRALGERLLRRAAYEWRLAVGDSVPLQGKLPGELLWEIGDLVEAQASLRKAAVVRGDASTWFRLADVMVAQGQTETARRVYRDALLIDPYDESFALVRDATVRSLPDLAEIEIGIEEEPVAWAAPVGMVLGVLPRVSGVEEDPVFRELGGVPAERSALRKARKFVEVLSRLSRPEIRTDGEAVITARRSLKALCPALFQVYLRGMGS